MVLCCSTFTQNNARKKLRASLTLGRDAGNTTRRFAMARDGLLIAILAAAASTTALKTPKSSRALKLSLKVRGGSTVQKVGTALIGLEGVVGMIAPEAACKNYGHDGRRLFFAFNRGAFLFPRPMCDSFESFRGGVRLWVDASLCSQTDVFSYCT